MAQVRATDPGTPLGRICHRLRDKGFQVLLVGGQVRDGLLGVPPGDPDLLTNAPIEALEDLFSTPRVTLAGKSLPICIVHHMEIAPWRCRSGEDIFPDSDLAHRDLTVNAMAKDPFTDEIFDPWQGRQDLKKKQIRFTGDPQTRIKEDGLRLVRACRFAARFGFDIEDQSWEAMKAHAPRLARVAPERFRGELIKAMAMETPSRFFVLLHDAGLLSYILPSLDRCWDLDGGPFHGETVFEHCMLVGDAITPKQPLLRLAGFLHDTGKFDARGIKEGRISYHGHETHTQALEGDLKTLRFSNQEQDYLLSLLRLHMRPLTEETTPKSVRRLLAALSEAGLSTRDFMRMRIADKKSNLKKPKAYTLSDIRLRLNKIRQEQVAGHAVTQKDLALTGRDIMALLGSGPGRRVGQIKAALLERVLEEPHLNTRAHLIPLVHYYKGQFRE